MHDLKTIVLNSTLIFLVLFYVYPLKFLARLILIPIAYITDNESLLQNFSGMIAGEDIGDLMIIYGIGAACVFFVLMMMYRYALKNSQELGLSEIEIFDTRISIRSNFLLGIIPVISVLFSILFRGEWYAGMISGFTYFLYTPVMMSHGKRVDRLRKKLLELKMPEVTPSTEPVV